MKIALAGTFNVIHDGHRKLFETAFGFNEQVFIGITSDSMAKSSKEDYIPLSIRIKELDKEISKYGNYEIFVIEDMYGPREYMDSMDVLVVSEETLSNGEKLNEERVSRGIPPLKLSVVPLVNSAYGNKISSSSILKGEYGRNGSHDVTDIGVGSLNHVKIEAVRTVMEKIYGEVRITPIDADSGVSEQPFELDTRRGAINRSMEALVGHDMGVGIEAGVFEKEDGLYDYQYCAISDRDGNITIGTGCGFKYPDEIADLVRNGMTVGDAVHEVYGKEHIGSGQGAIGLLSRGLLDRKGLTEQSVTAAMIPRLYPDH